MLDIAPALVTIGTALGVACAILGLVPQRDVSTPRCTACGAEIAAAILNGEHTCSCGAALSGQGAARFRRRWRPRLAILGGAILIASLALASVTTSVHASGLGWRSVAPTWLYARMIASEDGSRIDLALLRSRLASADRAERQQILNGLLDADPQRGDLKWSVSYWLDDAIGTDRDLRRRVLESRLAKISIRVRTENDAERIELGSSLDSLVFVRVDEITVDGTPVEFALDPVPEGPVRRWLALSSRGLRFRVNGRRIAETSVVRVRGEVADCGPLYDASLKDPLIREHDDPSAWELSCATVPLDGAATFAESRSPSAFGTVQPPNSLRSRWRAFVGPQPMSPMPAPIAACRQFGCLAVGALVGAILGIGLLTVRALTVSRFSDRAECASCGSILHGTTSSTCSECGRSLLSAGAVRFAGVRPDRLVGRALAAAVIAAAVGLGAWFGPTLATKASLWRQAQVASPEMYAEWLADQYLLPGALVRGDSAMNGIGNGITEHDFKHLGMDEETLRGAVRTIAERWRTAPALRVAETFERKRVLAAYCGALGHALQDADARDEKLMRSYLELLDAYGWPDIELPLCACEGTPLKIGGRLSEMRAELVLRTRSPGGDEGPWHRLSKKSFTLEPSLKAGDHAYDIEWGLVLLDFGEIDRNLTDDEVAQRLAKFPIRGEWKRTVRVVPLADCDKPVVDPSLDPFHAAPYSVIAIRRVGPRDLISLSTRFDTTGLEPRGRVELDVSEGTAGATRVIDLGMNGGAWGWNGIAALPATLPEFITARFIPESTDTAKPANAGKNPLLVWALPATLKYRYRGIDPERGFEIYELVRGNEE
ncbi:MAG: hypothetical protein JNM94_05815 [Phycisphaerae bacterium]|nr:hypothetical protein [Phycisphaerae bacterium]